MKRQQNLVFSSILIDQNNNITTGNSYKARTEIDVLRQQSLARHPQQQEVSQASARVFNHAFKH